MNRTPYYTRQVAQIKHLQQQHQQQQEQKQMLKEQQRDQHFLEWKSGINLSNKIQHQYFSNDIVNGKFKDPVSHEIVKEEEGILLGNTIFQSQTARQIMTEAREKAISLRIPGAVDEEEFIITLLGTNPENPLTRAPLSKLDAKVLYHYIYSGTIMPYDEQIGKTNITRKSASGKKQRNKKKKYKKKKHKSKKKRKT